MTDGNRFALSGVSDRRDGRYAAVTHEAEPRPRHGERGDRDTRSKSSGKKKDKTDRKKDKKQKSSKKAHREGRGDTSRSVSHIEDRVVPTLEPPAPEPPKQSPKKPLAFDPRHMMAPKVSLSRGARETGVKVEM